MAWTNLEFSFGTLLTSLKMTQLDDNFEALAAGVENAPSIVAAALASNSVTTAKITDANVTTAKIADNAVTTAKIPDNAITSAKINNGTITSTDMANDSVVYGIIADGAVGTGELKTSLPAEGSVSSSGFTAASSLVALPGGQYGFYPQIRGNDGNARGIATFLGGGTDLDPASINYAAPSSTHTTYINITADKAGGGGNSTIYYQQRYVAASPPYQINGVDFGPFIFALMNNQNEIYATWVAQDPPWWLLAPKVERKEGQPDGTIKKFYFEYAAIDKTQIKSNLNGYKAKLKKQVQEKRRLKELKTRENYILNTILNGRISDEEREAYQEEITNINAELSTFEVIEKEITPEVKNIRMNELPHPFMSKKPNDRVCILSPLESDYDFLADVMEDGGSISELLNEGYIEIKEETDLVSPNGCKIHRFGFK